ncbi:MAG: DUF327 family protein [Spirochaetales bacterium]|nr:DUF327 family protein [Spirochaetales bacterium]
MEKIDNLGNRFNFKSQEKKDKSKTHKVDKNNFSRLLKPIMEKNEADFDFDDKEGNKSLLSEFLDEVYRKGEELKDSPTLEHIKEYRWSIKRLLKAITDKMLALEEKVSGVNILKRKRFTLIKIIDTKMESLAAEILRSQHHQINILSKVDEINGLLVDLLS